MARPLTVKSAADEVVELPISADEAAKLIMSAGLIQPQGQAALPANGGGGEARQGADGDRRVRYRSVEGVALLWTLLVR